MPLPDPRLQPEAIERLRNGLYIMALHALEDRDAAEEVVQETLVRTVEALNDDTRAPPRNLGAFVRGIARHVVADVYAARRGKVSFESIPADAGGATHPDPLGDLVGEEERQMVAGAIKCLSPSDREILRLCYYEGLAPIEIADRTGEPAPRVRKRKSRALGRLREVMARRGDLASIPGRQWREDLYISETI